VLALQKEKGRKVYQWEARGKEGFWEGGKKVKRNLFSETDGTKEGTSDSPGKKKSKKKDKGEWGGRTGPRRWPINSRRGGGPGTKTQLNLERGGIEKKGGGRLKKDS